MLITSTPNQPFSLYQITDIEKGKETEEKIQAMTGGVIESGATGVTHKITEQIIIGGQRKGN